MEGGRQREEEVGERLYQSTPKPKKAAGMQLELGGRVVMVTLWLRAFGLLKSLTDPLWP